MRYSTQIDNVRSLEWGLNIQEAYVFSFLYSAPSWANEVVVSGEVYYFVSRNKAVKEIPLLTDKADTMYRFYKSLEKKGLVKFIKVEGKDCVKTTKKGKEWYAKIESESEYSENNPTKLGKLSETDSENNPTYKSTTSYKRKRDKSIESPPSFLDRGKTAKAMKQSICFESKEQMLQEISKTEYSEYLIQASAKWRGMNEKGKSAFLEEFAGKNATIKEYGGLKETYQTGIKTHMMNSLKYYEPAKEQTTSTYAYYYKIGNKEKKHNDKDMWERDKRNFGNGQGYKEISILV